MRWYFTVEPMDLFYSAIATGVRNLHGRGMQNFCVSAKQSLKNNNFGQVAYKACFGSVYKLQVLSSIYQIFGGDSLLPQSRRYILYGCNINEQHGFQSHLHDVMTSRSSINFKLITITAHLRMDTLSDNWLPVLNHVHMDSF